MKINEGKILLLLSGILSGIVITSFLISTSINQTRFLTYREYISLKNEENKLSTEVKGLEKELKELRVKYDKYNSSNHQGKSVEDTLRSELDQLNMFYGASRVTGSGIKITVDDRRFTFDDFDREKQLNITHNYDLVYLVNELINAGAEAVAINGERITNRTSISCVGLTILINGVHIVPPFKITAIGDPEALKYTLSLSESYYKYLAEGRRLNTDLEIDNNIEINGAAIGMEYDDLGPQNKVKK